MGALLLALAFAGYASWSDQVVNTLDILAYVCVFFATMRFIARWVS